MTTWHEINKYQMEVRMESSRGMIHYIKMEDCVKDIIT